MTDTLRSYEVLAVSGGWVAGKRYAVGSTVSLSDGDARYERDQGNIRLIGEAVVVLPPALLATDKFQATRNGVAVIASIADLAAVIGPLGGAADTAPPTITTLSAFAVAENTLFTTALTANEPVVWSLVSGAASPDFAAFTLSGSTLSFAPNLDVDFEDPDDADRNNSYIVTVKATDLANNSAVKTITVTVLDVVEVFAPTNTALPVVTGTALQGETLTVSTGTWTDNPVSFTYQWRRNGVPIAGAITPIYGLRAEDVGQMISVTITAVNTAGSGSESTTDTGPITPAIPVSTVQPAITGVIQVSQTLTVSNGTWSNNPTSYARQWKRNGTNISGATGTTYVPVTADVGAALTCTVTATNAGGSASRTSQPTAPVIAAGVALSISGTPVTSGTVGQAYAGFTVSAAGGTAPYVFSVQAGTLPAGLSLDSATGKISGTPTTAANSAGIVIRVTDSAGTPATADLASFSINVQAAVTPLAITGTPGTATVGQPYTFTPAVTGGSGTKSFSLAGTLPAGLSFSSTTGAVTGTPTTAGTTSGLSVTVTDTSGSAVLNGLSISVQSAGGYLLDTITAVPVAAHSLRKLRSAYSGPCIRVVRAADSVEQDIGFDSSGILDVAALLAFTGSGTGANAAVNVWYDQSPAANHATQTTASARVQMVKNGALISTLNNRPSMLFGANTGFASPVSASRSSRTDFIVGAYTTTTADFLRASVNNGYGVRVNVANSLLETYRQTSGGGVVIGASTATVTATQLNTFSVTLDNGNWTATINGGTPATGTSTEVLSANLTTIFGRSSNSFNKTAIIMFDGLISASDGAKIQASAKTFYGTP